MNEIEWSTGGKTEALRDKSIFKETTPQDDLCKLKTHIINTELSTILLTKQQLCTRSCFLCPVHKRPYSFIQNSF